ncbi:hypothetical protein LguiA_036342 [Lonicera macranthoides]
MEKRICIRTSSPESYHHMISSAGDLIGSNEDLLRMILIHIPHKPLCAFKSVSKLWLSIITDPDFSSRCNKRHVAYPSALSINRYFNLEFISLEGQRNNNPFGPYFVFDSVPLVDHSSHMIQVLQSCNGLLRLNLKVKLNLNSSEVRIGVYNPRTKHSKLIPKFPHRYSDLTNDTKLAFDPSKTWPHYKLVSVIPFRYHNEMLIYSSKTDSWKLLPTDSYDTIEYNCSLMFEAGVYLNGAIHWPNKRSRGSHYFDVDKERCRWMPMPPIQGGHEKRTIRYFGESGGHLHLIDYKDDFTLQFDVFEMKDDYSRWFVKYHVDLVTLGLDEYHIDLNPLSWFSLERFIILSLIVKNGNKVKGEEPVLMMYVPADKMVISYNLKDWESKELCPLFLNCGEIDNLNIENCCFNIHGNPVGWEGGDQSAYMWKKLGQWMWQKLDSLLCNAKWKTTFPDNVVNHLNRKQSDHAPLLFGKFSDHHGGHIGCFKFQKNVD